MLTELGQALVESARFERGAERRPERDAKLGEAREWFEKALALAPRHADALLGLSNVAAARGNFARAEHLAKVAVASKALRPW